MIILYRFLDALGIFLSSFYLRYRSAHRNSGSSYLNERPVEYIFALKNLLESNSLTVLDVGTGRNSFSATLEHCRFNVTSSDLKGHYWSFFSNRHVHVLKNDITDSRFKSSSFDAITCISTLEHIPDFNSAVSEMIRLLKPNGILILTFPYSKIFCENIYFLPESDVISKSFRYIAASFSDAEIQNWIFSLGITEIDRVYYRGWSGEYWRTGERINFPCLESNADFANGLCIAFKKSLQTYSTYN